MKLRSLIAVMIGLSLPAACISSARAQNAQAYEYMSASSPLKNGWTVTTQSVPGRPISTVVTPTPLGVAHATSAGANVTLVPTSLQSPAAGVQPVSTAASGGSWVWVPYNGVGMSPVGNPVYTQPTLGITSNNAMRPVVPGAVAVPTAFGPGVPGSANASQATTTANYAPPYTTGVPMVPFAPPAPLPGAGVPGAAVPGAAVPGAAVPSAILPGTVPTSYSSATGPAVPGAVAPAAAVGTAPTGNVAYYPYLTGDFAPVVATQNLPPGTYMGRGIVGQPTAYVDGQPVRNLFRYLFP